MLFIVVVHKHRMGKNIDCFSPLVACGAPYDTMKARPQGGSFQVKSSLTFQVL